MLGAHHHLYRDPLLVVATRWKILEVSVAIRFREVDAKAEDAGVRRQGVDSRIWGRK